MNFKITSRMVVLALVFFCSIWTSQAQERQKLIFQNGEIEVFSQSAIQQQDVWDGLPVFENRKYFLLSFSQIPKQSSFDLLTKEGLNFEGYLGEASYFASAKSDFQIALLQIYGLIAINKIPTAIKLDPALVRPNAFRPLEKQGEKILISIQAFETADLGKLNYFIWSNASFSPAKNRYSDHLVSGYLDPRDLEILAAHPAIQYIEPAAPLGEPEDREGRSLHRSHSIDNQLPGGRRYDGTGVTMAIADDGAIGPHIDFQGRVVQYTNNYSGNNTHGDMVSGIAIGAANLDPTKKGMAPGSILQLYSIVNYPHVVGAVGHFDTLGTTITCTSYSQGNGGVYTADAVSIDNQINTNPMLIHVFSAGNAGTANHGYGAGGGWGNITGGYKAAKNVITVANLRNTDQLESSSSRGPVQDGRIKPDIAANGYNQHSTGPNNTYLVGGGTSAAAPGIAGVMAQLSHAYRTANNDSIPPTALLKAALLNTAEDLGNVGPDYRFGWGRVNALRAVQTIEQELYFTGNISQGDSSVHLISIPANVKELRVMLYWADKAGTPNSTRALVNNLDLRLFAAGGTVHLPWVLDPTPSPTALNAPAVPGTDSINNVEQISLINPVAGTYDIRVLGTAIPFGPQRYWIVYEWYTEELTVSYPMGGEGFVPGETELIRWDAVGVPGNFEVAYSLDDGISWITIASNLANETRHLSWVVPQGLSSEARVRVSAGNNTAESEQNFTISHVVNHITITYICQTQIGLSWSPVAGAQSYIIHRLGQRYMDSIGISSTTSFTATGINVSDTDWFAITPIVANGMKGRRSLAVMKPANNLFGCQAAPAASFIASTLTACPDQEVILTDKSLNGATQWRWNITPTGFTFLHGTSDTSQSPFVAFNTLGTYTVQLIATNAFGSDSLQRINYIVISAGLNVPVIETFPTIAAPANWEVINPDNNITWRFRTGDGPSGTPSGMAWMNFYAYISEGQIDELISPVIDLTSGVIAPFLYFDVAYAQYAANTSDGLRIEISDDCGFSFVPSSYDKAGAALSTAGIITTNFLPSDTAHWRRDSVDLSPYLGSRIRIKFVAICDYGNNLFLTNFEVGTSNGMAINFQLDGGLCANSDISFVNNSIGNISSYIWNFGPDATPSTANSAGPHLVRYSTTGPKIASLSISGASGNLNRSQSFNVELPATAGFNYTSFGTQVSFASTSTNASAYYWDFGDGNSSITANPTHTYANANIYEVKHMALSTCQSDTSSRSLSVFATSAQENHALKALIFPNPGQRSFQINLNGLRADGDNLLEVRDLHGRTIYSELIPPGLNEVQHRFQLHFLSSGMYVVSWTNAGRHLSLPLIISQP